MGNNAHSLIPEENREAFARSLGYTSAAECDKEHDELHRVLSGFFDRSSPTLHWVTSGYADAAKAHPTMHEDAIGWEESLVLETARWLNTGEWGATLRVLWWLKIDPDKLRVALCRHLGREAVTT